MRRPAPPANATNGGLTLGASSILSNGKDPMFLSGFTWGPSCTDGSAAGLRTVLADAYAAPSAIFHAGPNASESALHVFDEVLRGHGAVGDIPSAFFGLAASLPDWMEAKYPGINNVTGPGWK